MPRTFRSRVARAVQISVLMGSFTARLVDSQGLAEKPDGATLHVDASTAFVPAGPPDYRVGSNRTPSGQVLGVTERYLTLDGKPWIPVIGELHYARVPEAEWEDEILKMKSAGVNVISTYIFWIHHEEVEGVWDWAGQRDLRHFAELCAKHGMLFFPRIGPWSHGEARNGGLPDWVTQVGLIRQLDPKFMAETNTFYQQIGMQLRGMLWKDGGPVIGVQLDNEYVAQGEGKGAAYILALKKMALANGLDVPLYTVTGWGNAAAPAPEVIPVFGGYPDAPWGSELTPLAPQEVYAFRFNSRASGNMGVIGESKTPSGQPDALAERLPFLTAEMGGGVQDTYHRRPVLGADDVVAMMPVMLGSGVNGYGTYMFHGGQNPDGRLSTLQESQDTKYPTDVPVKSYDFAAPIGEFGLERKSLRLMKEWNYFLNDFGAILAPMRSFEPDIVPNGPEDLGPLRWSVRTNGKSGFIFVNNHVRESAMASRPHTQFAVALPGGRTLRIPDAPVDIPSGAYFAWPFSLDLSGVPLRYATAQLIARLGEPKTTAKAETYLFTCVRGIRCEVVLDLPRSAVTAPPGVAVSERNGATVITRPENDNSQTAGSFPAPLRLRTTSGANVSLLLLSAGEAADAWKVNVDSGSALLLTSADVVADRDKTTLRQLDDPAFHFALYPESVHTPKSSAALRRPDGARYTGTVSRVAATAVVTEIRKAGAVPPVQAGPQLWRAHGVAQAPGDAVWAADAARWQVEVKPSKIPSSVGNLFLQVKYTGDEARLESGGKLLADDFFKGQPWLIGLRRYTASDALPRLQLDILPMRADAPIYLPAFARKTIATTGQTVRLTGVTIVPLYQLQIGIIK